MKGDDLQAAGPLWSRDHRAQNERLTAAALHAPLGECPRCHTALVAPRSDCPACKRRDWCPTCGELLIRASTRRCERCGQPTACPFCGAEFKPDTHAPCPWCHAPVQCRACGYSLEGNTSGRCPECGADATPRVLPAGIWPPQTDAAKRVDSFVSWTAVLLLQVFAACVLFGLAALVVGGLVAYLVFLLE